MRAPGNRGSFISGENRRMNPAPIKPLVPFSALEALDVRVGTIRKVEDVPKSDKLLHYDPAAGMRVR